MLKSFKGWFLQARGSEFKSLFEAQKFMINAAFQFHLPLRRLRSCIENHVVGVESESKRTQPITKRWNKYCDQCILSLLLSTLTISQFSVLSQFFALALLSSNLCNYFQHLILSNCKQGNYNYQYNMFCYRQLKLTIILLLITTPRVK